MLIRALKISGNPSSPHEEGRAARQLLDNSRKICAEYLGVRPDEIVFTSGATEADNLAIRGVFEASNIKNPEIIIGAAEHPAVVESAKWLRQQGTVLKIAPVDRRGRIDSKAFEKLLSPKTVLVSVAFANHEVGTIQPLKEIVRLVRKFERQNKTKIIFHTDASAAGCLEINIQKLGVDLLTLDSIKIGGPPGAGLLYVRRGTPLAPQLLGGGQENGRRPGTENLPASAGFAAALKEVGKNFAENFSRLAERRKFFLKRIEKLPVAVNGHQTETVPNIINLHIGHDADYFVQQLNARGISISARAACRAGERSSDVLQAMGFNEKYASECIRISFGPKTKKSELAILTKAFKDLLLIKS